MEIASFELERYFARHEFKVKYVLSASDPESLTAREVLSMADEESRSLWEDLSLGYTESSGHPLLRREISLLYQSITADDVLVAAPEELIFIAMQSLLHPGDHVIVTQPAYQSLHEVARSAGCEVSGWMLRTANGRWALDLDELESLVRPRTRLLVVNFPHNPTGYLPTGAQFEAIVDVARRHGLFLFCDEMYRGLEHFPGTQLPAACDIYDRAISLSGLSKAYALPGLRIGWLATQQPQLIDRFIALHDYITICSSAPSEILALMALRARSRILARNIDIIRENKTRAEVFFARYEHEFEWLSPDAGSVAFPRLRMPLSSLDFCERLLEMESVMLAPGEKFGCADGHFRLGLGRRSFEPALRRVEAFLADDHLR